MILNGFRFGLLLQLAVGPMCFLVFNTSVNSGFVSSFMLVLAITLVDAIFIVLSILGVGSILNKKNIRNAVKIFGAVVLVLFGLNMLFVAFDKNLLPNMNLFSAIIGTNIFVQGIVLTVSNPLTIIFWSGVFSAQVIENQYNKKELYLFGLGCILSTLIFLTGILALGMIISSFLTKFVMQLLNICVGFIIIYFGLKLVFNAK